MKILVLSGGCGVGKRSVGEILAKEISLPLIPNHLTANIARSVYGEHCQSNSSQYRSLLCALRKEIISNAHKNDLPGLIMTHSNHAIIGAGYHAWLNKVCSELGVDLQFINLFCEEDERRRRFLSEERRVFDKPFDLKTFKKINNNWGDPALISEKEYKVIGSFDITNKTPQETVENIIKIL